MMSNTTLKRNKKRQKQHTPLKPTNLMDNTGTKQKVQLMLTTSLNFKVAPVHKKVMEAASQTIHLESNFFTQLTYMAMNVASLH